MATVYFTSNADSGAGTLRAALAEAEAGDVITYDPNVFTSGPVIIAVSSALIVTTKNLTFDGGALGIVLDGQQANIACVSLTTGTPTITFVNFTIKRFNRSANGPIFLNSSGVVVNLHRCKIVDNQNNYFGAIYILNGTVNLYDSLVTGNNSKTNGSSYAGGIRLGNNGYLNLVRSTVVFNTNANVYGGTERQTITDSFVGFDSYSELGDIEYVNPPEEAYITFGDWVEGLWQNYDFRLKPTSPYLTGATYQSGDVDLLGHARTGSWGCYDGSWIVVGASGSGTVSSDTTVDYLEISASGTLTLSGSDRILTVSKGVYFTSGGAATSSTRGYIVLPAGASASALTLTNVVACYSGAGASNLSAETTGISWSSIDSTVSVVLELYSGSAWTTITQTSGTSYSTTLAEGAQVRLFDGVSFLTATVPVTPTPSGEVSPFWTIKRWAVVDTSGGTSAGAWDVNSWIVVSAGGSYSVNHWALDPEVE